MRAVDASIVVRLIARDDPQQVARAEAFVAPGAWVALPVLAEAIWVLKSAYGLNRRRIGVVVGMLIEHDRLALQDEDVVRKAHSTFERERSIEFSDCLIVESARKAGHVPVGTFDRKMARLEGTSRV